MLVPYPNAIGSKWKCLKAEDYRLVYDLDLANLGVDIHYDVDNSAAITAPFDRIAYFVELQRSDGETRFLYVSLDAFTDNLKMIGVPTLASGAHFQQPVARMNTWSNTGVHNGIGLAGGHNRILAQQLRPCQHRRCAQCLSA